MAVIGDQYKILDADASGAHTIRPGLHGDDVTSAQNCRRRTSHKRVLVNVESHPVTGAVNEELTKAMGLENLATGRIDLARRNTIANGGETGCLRLGNGGVPTELLC